MVIGCGREPQEDRLVSVTPSLGGESGNGLRSATKKAENLECEGLGTMHRCRKWAKIKNVQKTHEKCCIFQRKIVYIAKRQYRRNC